MSIQITEEKLKILVKKNVREVLEQELARIRSLIIPFISEKEQIDIEKRYKQPSRKIAGSFKLKV